MMRPKVLFFSRVSAEPNARGNATYMRDLMRALDAAGIDVELALLDEVPGPPPPAWDSPATAAERDFARQRIRESRPHVVLVNYTCLADLLDAAPAGTLTAILTHDVCWRRAAVFAEAGARQDGLRWDRESETALLAKARLLVAIQAEEARILAEMAPGAEVLLAPFSMRPTPIATPPRPGRCLFVGSDADHNRASLLWFLDAAWPLVLTARPEATLSVCGTVNHRIKKTFPNVTMHGRVEDLEPQYAEAAVCIAPRLVGSGLEIKLVEAMGHGKCCVVNVRGLSALPSECRDAVLPAADADGFAATLLRALGDEDLRRSVGRQALDCVRRFFNPERAYGPLAARIRRQATENGVHAPQGDACSREGQSRSLLCKKSGTV